MKKLLLLLLGLILIGILTYLCFSSKAISIQNDLIGKTEALYAQEGIKGIQVNGDGEKLKVTRILTLKGRVSTEKEKEYIALLTRNIEGVSEINNNIIVKIKKEPSLSREITTLKSPSPYTLHAKKKETGKVLLRGFVENNTMHKQLVTKAKTIFGEHNVTDKLEDIKGSPKAWYVSSELGLKKLKEVKYGHFKISDQNFSFYGYVDDENSIPSFLQNLENELNSNYRGKYTLDSAEPLKSTSPKMKEVAHIEVTSEKEKNKSLDKFCQKQFKELLSKNKINFSYNKANLQSSSHILLTKIIETLKACPKANIVIEGHTDTDGSKRYNQMLSEKRAKAVKVYLVKKGVKEDRLTAIGYGEIKPITSNHNRIGKELNRRIELNIKGIR